MRIMAWNMRRASKLSNAWSYLLETEPDIALLQEVVGVPTAISSKYSVLFARASGKTGRAQPFGSAILARTTSFLRSVNIESKHAWVNDELARLGGFIVAAELGQEDERMCAVSVHSPAWRIDTARLQGVDVSPVKLVHGRGIWAADLVLAALTNAGSDRQVIVGGDFNLSETFDRKNKPRGNREYLDRTAALGFTECLRATHGSLVPTYRNARGGRVVHQMDHLFLSHPFTARLKACAVGEAKRVFGSNLSDHLPIIAQLR